MKVLDKLMVIMSIMVALLCFIMAGRDLAGCIKFMAEGHYLAAIMDFLFAIWLFYWGCRNSKNVLTRIKRIKQ